jgi:hypothetical protein
MPNAVRVMRTRLGIVSALDRRKAENRTLLSDHGFKGSYYPPEAVIKAGEKPPRGNVVFRIANGKTSHCEPRIIRFGVDEDTFREGPLRQLMCRTGPFSPRRTCFVFL